MENIAEKPDEYLLILCLEDDREAERLSLSIGSEIPELRVRSAAGDSEAAAALSSEEADFLLMDLAVFERVRDDVTGVRPLAVLVCSLEERERGREQAVRGAFDIFLRGESEAAETERRISAYFRVLSALRRRFRGAFSVLENRYENLVRALPDIIYELDTQGRFSFVNDAVSLLGYEPEELIGKHFSTILHESDAQVVDRDSVLGLYEGATTGLNLSPKLFNERRGLDRKTENLEIRIKRKPGFGGGEEMIATVISYGEVSAAGNYGLCAGRREFLGSVGIIRDVTLRLKSEETLRKLYQAVDQLSACVCIMNRSFEMEYINPAFLQTTRFSPLDVLGRDLFGFLRYTPERVKEIRSLVLDGFDVRDEIPVLGANGKEFWASVLLSPVRSPEGVIKHAIAILEDISSRKAMEDLLRAAKEEAEEAARGKDTFLVNLGNELKGPVSAILSAAQLIRMVPQDGARHSEQIIFSARALLETLNGILDLTRSKSRTDDRPSRRTFQLGGFIQRICEPYRERAMRKGLVFEIRAEGDEVVQSDPDKLGRVVGVLADNAVRATDSGEVIVDYFLDRKEGNVPHLVLTVSDNGVGLTAREQARIFDPAYEGDESDRTKIHGRGVGLALARNLIRALGGEIRVESSPGRGSRFSVLLPLGTPGMDGEGQALPSPRRALLVVDDNEVNLEYMRALLEAAGHEVRAATGAMEALSILDARITDAVLLDIQMPGISGLEFARRVRASPGLRYPADLPLIALTAFDPSEVEDPGVRFDGIFSKPADIQRLLSAVDTALSRTDAASPVLFAERNPGSLDERASLLARVEAEGRAALADLGSALGAERNADAPAREDARAAAGRLIAAFDILAAPGASFAARQFEIFYPTEDASCLAVRLSRLRNALDAALARLRE